MPDLFGIDIAGEIAAAFSGQLLTGTLHKRQGVARTSGNLTGGTKGTPVNYTFEGFLDQTSVTQKDGSGLATSHGKYLVILGGSITVVPEKGDTATIEGATWQLVEMVERDPAAATYKFLVEK